MVRVVVVVESTRRMIYLGRAPLSLSLPFSPSHLMLISSHRNCTKARHVWSVNFCHHKSIGHARGGGSFRRMGGGPPYSHLGHTISYCRNPNVVQRWRNLGLKISLEHIYILKSIASTRIDKFHFILSGDMFPSLFFPIRATAVFIKRAAAPSRDISDSSSSSSSSSSSLVPLNRASKSSSSRGLGELPQIVVYTFPEKRPPKRRRKKKKTRP